MKEIVIKTVCTDVCNEDDIELAVLYVPDNVSLEEVQKKVNEVNDFLLEEGESEECLYAIKGYNAETLLSELQVRTGWYYKYVIPEITVRF